MCVLSARGIMLLTPALVGVVGNVLLLMRTTFSQSPLTMELVVLLLRGLLVQISTVPLEMKLVPILTAPLEMMLVLMPRFLMPLVLLVFLMLMAMQFFV